MVKYTVQRLSLLHSGSFTEALISSLNCFQPSVSMSLLRFEFFICKDFFYRPHCVPSALSSNKGTRLYSSLADMILSREQALYL